VENRFLLLTGGTLTKEFLIRFLEENSFEKLVCVDGALELTEDLGLEPDYLVGDFDTVSGEVLDNFLRRQKTEKKPTKVEKFLPEKDKTDTELAIELALSEGATKIILLGATGTRLDHTLANIQLLVKPLALGVFACLYDEYNKAYLIEKEGRFYRDSLYGPYLSFVPFGGRVKGVKQTGFKYNACDTDFIIGTSLGISNELLKEEGSITFLEGRLLVIEAKDAK
jgi:thiamine pyrophosphokinase